MRIRPSRRIFVGGSLAWALGGTSSLLAPLRAFAQTDRALQKQQMAETVDTAKFKKSGPYTIGVAAGYMSNSWVVFCLQHIRWEASLHKDVRDVIVTDAAFNPGKQVADIRYVALTKPGDRRNVF